MDKLHNLIHGIEILQSVKIGNDTPPFVDGFYIQLGDPHCYTAEQKQQLERLGFHADNVNECFRFCWHEEPVSEIFIDICTNYGDITNVSFKRDFKDITLQDILDAARKKYKQADLMIQAWALSYPDELNNQ